MKPVPIYKINTSLESSDTDYFRELSMSSAFLYFQDIAAAHSENLGAGVKELKIKQDVAWIVMRMRVEVERMPGLDEEIIIETWPRSGAPLYERDYRILSQSGETLVRATSIWIIMELESREIIKKHIVEYKKIEIHREKAVSTKLRQLRAPAPPEFNYKNKLRYTDIDYNDHVNNTKYVDYSYDCFPLDYHKKNRVKAFEINFINEGKYGETLDLLSSAYPADSRTDSLDEAFFIEGKAKEDGRVVFKAKMEFTRRME